MHALHVSFSSIRRSEKVFTGKASAFFIFLTRFFKVIHKYVSENILSKSRPLALRHCWWRRGYTSRRQRVWRLCRGHVGGVDADLVASSAPWIWAPSFAPKIMALSLAPKILASRWCFNPALNLAALAFFLFFLLALVFFLSPLRPTSRIGILDLGNFDLIHRSTRARYPRSLLVFFQIDSVYIGQIF